MHFRKSVKRYSFLMAALFVLLSINVLADEREWHEVTAGRMTGLREYIDNTKVGDRITWSKNSSDDIYYWAYINHPSHKDHQSLRTRTGFIVLDMMETKIIDGIEFQNALITSYLTENIGAVAIYVGDESNPNFDSFLRESYTEQLFSGAIQPDIDATAFWRDKIEFSSVECRYLLIEVIARNLHVRNGDMNNPDYKVQSVRFNDIRVSETEETLPDQTLSKIFVSKTSCLADGEETISVEVKVVDADNNNLLNQIVELELGEADVLVEPQNEGKTNDDGVATFLLSSTQSGNIIITAKAGPDRGSLLLLDDEQEVEFIQVIEDDDREWHEVTAGRMTGLREYIDNTKVGDRITWSLQGGIEYYGYINHPSHNDYQSLRTRTGFIVLDMMETKIIDGIEFQNALITTHLTENIGAVAIYVGDESNLNFDRFSRESYTEQLFSGALQPVIDDTALWRDKIEFSRVECRYLLIEVIARNLHVRNGDMNNPDYKIQSVRFNDIRVSEIEETLPDQTLSKIFVSKTSCLADGEETISVEVKVIDADNNNLPNQIVELELGEADVLVEPQNEGKTNDDGVATFLLSSTQSGNIIITAKAGPDRESLLLLDDEQEVEFIQVIEDDDREWHEVTAGRMTGLREYIDNTKVGDRITRSLQGGIEYYGYINNPTDSNYQSLRTRTGFIVLDMMEAKIIDGIEFQNALITTHLTENIGAVAIYVGDESNPNFDRFSRESYTEQLFSGALQPVIDATAFWRDKIEFPILKCRYLLIEVIARNLHVRNGDMNQPDYKLNNVRFNDVRVSVTEGEFLDQALSKVMASQTSCFADGEKTILVEVKVVDANNNHLANQRVELELGEADVVVEAQEQGITNDEGIAVFLLSSTKSGFITVKAKAGPNQEGMPLLPLNQEIEIEFIQAVDIDQSLIELIDQGPISADGVSSHLIEISLLDYDGQPILDEYKVSLHYDLSVLFIEEDEKNTEENGIVTFSIATLGKHEEPITSEVTVFIEIDNNEKQLGKKTINFARRLRNEEDDDESFSEVKFIKHLAIGLVNTEFESLESVPTDGLSGWGIQVQLRDKEGPVKERWVTITEISDPEGLGQGDIQPGNMRLTDDNGNAEFFISTKNMLDKVELEIQVLNDSGVGWTKELSFTSIETFKPYVIAAKPSDKQEDAELNGPIEVTFNKKVKLSKDPMSPTKIILTPTSDHPGSPQVIEGSYDLDLIGWDVDGQTVIWYHPRLEEGVSYSASIDGVLDLDDRQMIFYEWNFKGGADNQPPYIFDHKPGSWEVGVTTETNLEITFNEPLLFENGKPYGLTIELLDINGNLVPNGSVQYSYYDPEKYKVFYNLMGLASNSTYTIMVRGAHDLARNRMEEAISWQFTTESLGDLEVVGFILDKNIFNEVRVDTSISIYFSKQLEISGEPQLKLMKKGTDFNITGVTSSIGEGDSIVGLKFELEYGNILEHDRFYIVSLTNVVKEDGEPFEWSSEFLTEVSSSGKIKVEGEEGLYIFEVPRGTGANKNIEIYVPSLAVSPDTYFEVRNVAESYTHEIRNKTNRDSLVVTDELYDFISYRGENVNNDIFVSPVTISIPFEYAAEPGKVRALDGRLVPATSLRIFTWNKLREEWIPLGGDVDLENKTVSYTIEHFSIYGLLGTFNPPTTKFLSETVFTNNPVRLAGDGTVLKFHLSKPAFVTVKLYERNGRLVKTLIDHREYLDGYNGISINRNTVGSDLPRGLYIVQLYVADNDESTVFNEVLGIW